MSSAFLQDLIDHKQHVAGYMQLVASELFRRAAVHDNSKFSPEEFDIYEATFSELQKVAYGSPEYKEAVKKLGPAWSHHCKFNDHHPECFEEGVKGMDFIQLIEMLCDWLAASERSQTNFLEGLDMNKERFYIDDSLFNALKRTAGWIAPEKLSE